MIKDFIGTYFDSIPDSIFSILVVLTFTLGCALLVALLLDIGSGILASVCELFVPTKTLTTDKFRVRSIASRTDLVFLPVGDALIPTPITVDAHIKVSLTIDGRLVSFNVYGDVKGKKLTVTYKKTFTIRVKRFRFF